MKSPAFVDLCNMNGNDDFGQNLTRYLLSGLNGSICAGMIIRFFVDINKELNIKNFIVFDGYFIVHLERNVDKQVAIVL